MIVARVKSTASMHRDVERREIIWSHHAIIDFRRVAAAWYLESLPAMHAGKRLRTGKGGGLNTGQRREPRFKFTIVGLRMPGIGSSRNRRAQSQQMIGAKAGIDCIDALHRLEQQSRAG